MRDYVIFGLVFGLLPFIPKRPVIGVLAFAWLSLMNPHRLTYGAAYNFPFAAIVAVVTLVSLFLSREPKRLPFTAVTVTLILFFAWMTTTSFFALEPGLVWDVWDKVMKTFFMVLVAMLAINSKKDIQAMAWVTGLSLGFYGLKGAIFTLTSGGANRVLGPAGSYISDNNDLALALVISVPIIWYLQLHADRKWLRIGLAALAVLTVVAAVGTYSRGALLAGSSMLIFLWLKSRQKLATGFALLLIVPLVYMIMPEQWFGRMETIGEYKQDASAQGRFNAWGFAANVAKDNLLGGGFNVFTPKMFILYGPDPHDAHAAHSIYFRALGEHGYIGLALFLLLMLFAWRTGTRVIRFCTGKAELKWAADLAAMCQVSIIGYAVGGAFLSLTYYDFYYYVIALLFLMEKLLLLKAPKSDNRSIPSSAPIAHNPSERGKSA